jgi:ankyrin repeat protein
MMRLPVLLTLAVLTFGSPALAAPLDDAAQSGDAELVARLLDDGADINAAGTFGTALHWAALNGHGEVAALLAARGADLDASSEALGMPLHAAAQRGHDGVARVLLDRGAAVDPRNRDQFTPLHLAAHYGHAGVARALIDHGADVNAVGVSSGGAVLGDGLTSPLHLAFRGGHGEIVAALRSAGAAPAPIEPMATRLAAADPGLGREIAYTFCRQCHVLEPGDGPTLNDFAGPTLVGVVDRPVAAVEGFDYSKALKDFGGTWTADRLYAFALHPMLTVPGTEMNFAPERKADDMANVVAYLKARSP